jgi:hypothetical protein
MYGKHPSEETIKKMSESHRGKNNSNYGKDFSGENSPKTKLTWEDIGWIREHRTEYTARQLGEMFNISKFTIGDICHGETWKDSTYIPFLIKRNQSGENNPRAELTWENVRWIKEHRQEYTSKKLAKMFNVSISTIYHIFYGITWKEGINDIF